VLGALTRSRQELDGDGSFRELIAASANPLEVIRPAGYVLDP
jgi:hypothetical protein